MFYIVEKIELISPDDFIRENIGYVAKDADNVRMIFESQISAMTWIGMNRDRLQSGELSVIDYLKEFGTVYGTPVLTMCIDGLGLSEITDIPKLLGRV